MVALCLSDGVYHHTIYPEREPIRGIHGLRLYQEIRLIQALVCVASCIHLATSLCPEKKPTEKTTYSSSDFKLSSLSPTEMFFLFVKCDFFSVF